ncbi:unnamed protein product [Sphagnum tenellum]
MKASVKVRGEGKKPLIRAKLPITILGLPFVSAITAGNAEELALHVGAYLALGPSPSSSSSCSCKLSYRPNDEHRAFTLVLKTTGSGLGKETCSSSPPLHGLSSIPVHKNKRLEDVDRASQASEDDNSSMVLISGEDLESHKDLALAAAAAEVIPPAQREENKGNDNNGGGGGWRRRMSRLQENAKSWNLFVRNVFPLGRNVVGLVQWGVGFPPTTNNIFHSFGNQESSDSSVSVRSFLPVLVMDKISIESVNPLRRSLLAAEPRHWYAMEEAPSSSSKYGLMMEEEQEGLSSIEQSCQAEHIAAMCCSLQHQLHILHSQNQVLKKTMDNMRIDIVAQGKKKFIFDEEEEFACRVFDDAGGGGEHAAVTIVSRPKCEI